MGRWSFRLILWYVMFLFTQPHLRFHFLIPLHIGDICFMGAFGLHILDRLGKSEAIIHFGAATKIAIALMLLALASHYFNPMQRSTAWNVHIDGMVKVSAIVILLEAQVNTIYRATAIMAALGLSAIYWIKSGVRLAYAGASWGSGDRIMGANVSIIKNPNDMAYLIVFMIPIYFYFYRTLKPLWLKAICVGCMGGCAYVAWQTGSRTGMLAMVCMGLALLPYLFRYDRKFMVGGLAGALLIFTLLIPSGNQQRFASIVDAVLVALKRQEHYGEGVARADAESAESRGIKMRAAWDLITDYPILGVGTDPYPRVYAGRPDAGGSIHCEILMAGRHMGFPGMIVYILAIALPIRLALKVRRRCMHTWPAIADLAYMIIPMMVVVIVGGFVSPSLFHFPHMMMLTCMSAVYSNVLKMNIQPVAARQGNQRGRRAVAVA